MDRTEWAFDDIVLGALLGAWMGTNKDLWANPVIAFLSIGSVVTLVFFGRQLVVGRGDGRKTASVPAILAAVIIGLETYAQLIVVGTLEQLLAILAVWGVSISIRWYVTPRDSRSASPDAAHNGPATAVGSTETAPPARSG